MQASRSRFYCARAPRAPRVIDSINVGLAQARPTSRRKVVLKWKSVSVTGVDVPFV